MLAWLKADRAKQLFALQPDNAAVAEMVVHLAQATGFFSIWMEVFCAEPEMRRRLIDAFPGTRESGCFDPQTSKPIQPAPNPDHLPHGGKV